MSKPEATWFIRKNNVETGPFRFEEMRRKLAAGEIHSNEMIRKDNQFQCFPLQTHDEFRALVAVSNRPGGGDQDDLSIFVESAGLDEATRTLISQRNLQNNPGFKTEVKQATKLAKKASKDFDSKVNALRPKGSSAPKPQPGANNKAIIFLIAVLFFVSVLAFFYVKGNT